MTMSKMSSEPAGKAYVICPRIEEPDPDKETAINMKSVMAEAKRLKKKTFSKLADRTPTAKWLQLKRTCNERF